MMPKNMKVIVMKEILPIRLFIVLLAVCFGAGDEQKRRWMMKRMLIFLMVTFASLSFAITKEQVKKSNSYYFGEATASVYQEAKDLAMKELSERIMVQVTVSTINMEKETNMSVEDYKKSVIETYSMQTLPNVGVINEPVGNRVNVFVYVHKDEVSQIFEDRRKLIFDIFNEADKAEGNANIRAALKYYYFSILLMYSLPEERLEYKGIKFHTELPTRIRGIMRKLRFEVHSTREVSEDEKQVILNIYYDNKSVEEIDFSFWDCFTVISATGRDGQATISLFGASKEMKEITISPDYSYYEQRDEFPAVKQLWSLVTRPNFDTSLKVSLTNKTPETRKPKRVFDDYNVALDEIKVSKNVKTQTDKFITLIRENNISKIKEAFPNDKYLQNQIKCLFELNKIRIVETDTHMSINSTFDGWEVRSIPVIAHYPTLNKQVTEKLVLNFDKQGMLNDVQFSVFEGMYEEAMMGATTEEEKKRRQILVKFIEKYRSTFFYRDIETIDTLFSDDAVIIVGRILRRTPMDKDIKCPDLDFEQIRHTKQSYIDNLKRVFKRQEDIHLGFNSFKIVVKNDRPGVYSVSMRQNHSSTTYSDEGYLFLMIDFNQPEPKIYVRSWQPGEWSTEHMIEMPNFHLN